MAGTAGQGLSGGRPPTSAASPRPLKPLLMMYLRITVTRERIAQLRRAWAEVEFPHPPGLIQGDAHPNNLLRDSLGRVVLGDWDHVAAGPREWDLMQIHYMHRRFGRVSAGQLDEFADAYGWDIHEWPGLDLLVAIRELSGLSPYVRTASGKEFSRKELAHRVDSLQAGDTAARWSSPPKGS